MFNFRRQCWWNASINLFWNTIFIYFTIGHVTLSKRRIFYSMLVWQLKLRENKLLFLLPNFFSLFYSYLKEASDSFSKIFLSQWISRRDIQVFYMPVLPVCKKRLVWKLINSRFTVNKLTINIGFWLLGPRLKFGWLELQKQILLN